MTNRRNLIALGLCLFAFTLPSVSWANATVKTNLPGVVVKELRCNTGYIDNYRGNIVNRSKRSVEGTVAIKVFDRDGDPVGGCTSQVNLAAESGDAFFASDCNCAHAQSTKITIR